MIIGNQWPIAVLAVLGVHAGAGTSAVKATPLVGSTSYATLRSCSAVTSAQPCDSVGPGQTIVAGQYAGGLGVGGLNDFQPRPDDRAWSFVRFNGQLDLPEISAFTRAADDSRTSINVVAFQSYTWTGQSSTEFSISGTLHIVDSSTSPNGGAGIDGAMYFQYISIIDPARISGLNTPQELFTALVFRPCGTNGVLGAGSNGGVGPPYAGTLTGGPAYFSATTSECAPGSLTLTPGQSVLLAVGLALPVNRGGFADASSTFTTRLGDNLSSGTRDQLQSSLLSAIAQGAVVTGVPEPQSWAMLMAGFGLVGAAVRRQRAVAAQTKL